MGPHNSIRVWTGGEELYKDTHYHYYLALLNLLLVFNTNISPKLT
jgi:hypothetical protein